MKVGFYRNRLQSKEAVHTIVNRRIPFCPRNDYLLAAGSDLRRGMKTIRTGMCRFCLGEGRGEERQQFYQGRAFISQRVFKTDGDSDYLSIS
jgi:hypothetical protein